jgi:hypothetical protein
MSKIPDTMTSVSSDSANSLPPVQPPSGRFIVQLFLVPGLIVTVAVLILLGFSGLVGGESAPDKLMERLESPNAEVRWRAANEIAQRLKRDDDLASDPKLALRLTTLLQKAADDLDRIPVGKNDKERADEKKSVLEKRKDIEFLGPCVGNLMVPAGAAVLSDLAVKGRGRDAKSQALLRRQAVWALGNLGENVKRFQSLPAERRETILAELAAASVASGPQAEWARQALGFLDGSKTNVGVIAALAESAKADDPYLRTLVALALTFWEGEGDERVLAENTLKTLSRDDGHGTRIEIGDAD